MGIFDHRALPISGRFERWIARGLRLDQDPAVRFRCAYFAGTLSSGPLTSALVRGAGDPEEHHVVRVRCLESLTGHAESLLPRTRRDRKVYSVILESLRDSHPNVRFWACFAAGSLRLLAAQSALRDLRGDEGLGCMGWTVAYEAGEALKAIQGKPAWADDRRPGDNPYPSLL